MVRALAILAIVGLTAPTPAAGFTLERVALISSARELAFAPDGTLFVGTGGGVYAFTRAEGSPGTPYAFFSPGDDPDDGVTFSNGLLYVGTEHAVWRVPYRSGERHPAAAATIVARVRSGQPPPGSDGDVHTTTSVASDAAHVYAAVGSSCNACVEIDPTRATVGDVRAGSYSIIARRIRNAIALALDARGSLWVSDAGQDELPPPHPYEFLDNLGARSKPADYGWPYCFENHRHKPGTTQSCAGVVEPDVVFPAYETPIGAVFYPAHARGRYAFPARYAGGAFVTLHGSWHGPAQGLPGYLPPRVVFVPMRDGRPVRPVRWDDPTTQWEPFVTGYQEGGTTARSGRPTGIAVGPEGSLFIADDEAGAVYRVRPR